MRAKLSSSPLFLGIDFGTGGCRAVVVDRTKQIRASARTSLESPVIDGDFVSQDPQLWWQALTTCIVELKQKIDCKKIACVAVDGTSGTLLLTDAQGRPLTPALMYNDARGGKQAEKIQAVAGEDAGALGTHSALAKLMWLTGAGMAAGASHALHQGDWITGMLLGKFGDSDYNNALKLGFDPVRLQWPPWLARLDIDMTLLPAVHSPGTRRGRISPSRADELGLAPSTDVVSGTTDGVAAFLASGASTVGEAVTSLGSTLILKLLSPVTVNAAEYGVYSHRLGKLWLAGGASNSGGAVLEKYFSTKEMQHMTPALNPAQPSGLDYYPLIKPGERFPINDPLLSPRLLPAADTPLEFFQGLLEGIAAIEKQGYQRLRKLGGPALVRIITTGGGSGNPAWTDIRRRILAVPVERAETPEAAFGTALLAAGLTAFNQ